MNAYFKENRFVGGTTALLVLFSLVVSAFSVAFFVANAQSAPDGVLNTEGTAYDNPDHSIGVCRATDAGGYTNPSETVSTIISGTGYANDIIPPFWYDIDGDASTTPELYMGNNWDTEGKAIYDAGCDKPGPSTGTIIVKKATSELGDSVEFDFTGDLGDFQLFGNTEESFEMEAGEYTFAESAEDGWELTSLTCDAGSPVYSDSSVTVTLAVEETITCTFTNGVVTEPTTDVKIKVFKYVLPNGDGDYGPAVPGDFSFQIDDDTPIPFALTPFGALGTDLKAVNATYTISEVAIPTDYEHVFTHCEVYSNEYDDDTAEDMYNSCVGVPTPVNEVYLDPDADLAICVITNIFTGTTTSTTTDDGGGDDDDDDNGGGGSSDPDTYRIDGYVWHDDNENTVWDGVDTEEQSTTTEDHLSGRTVQITNGTDTFSTTTDGTGYYYFEVEAGTWTITQTLPSGWDLTTPVSGSFEVTVPEVQTFTFLETVVDFLIPTAHAAVVGSAGPFNFGNNESETVTSGGGSSGGGGGTTNRSGNRSTRRSSDSDSGGSSNTDAPTGQVLGDQVSVVPEGAPATGAGGTAPNTAPVTQLLLAPLTATMRRNGR